VAKLARENNVQVTPEQILVTPGGKWALYTTLAATTNPGDEVLILDPAWVSYGPMVQLQRAVPVHVPLPSDDDFRITIEQLEAHVTEQQ
jgi:aspartate aminotransferase